MADRFRRALGGYDRAQVDAAIDARDTRLARLEAEAQRLAERVVEREKRLQGALSRLGDDAENMFTSGTVSALTKGLEEIYATARRQATRIRMKALDDAVQMADRVTELTRLRDELTARVGELADKAGIKLGGEDRAPVGTEPREAVRRRLRGRGRGRGRPDRRLRAAGRVRGRGVGHRRCLGDPRQPVRRSARHGSR